MGNPATKADVVRTRLLGHWELVSYTAMSADGKSRPYGAARGRLCYDADGAMAGQIMRAHREETAAKRNADARAAYLTYIAYFGTFDVVDDGDTVVHHVSGALNPEWVGTALRRTIRFDGDRLILAARLDTGSRWNAHVIEWTRAARAVAQPTERILRVAAGGAR